MRLSKRILQSGPVQAVLCWITAQYIRLVYKTSRWTVEGDAVARARWQAGQPFILCFWHGRLLMMPYCWDRTRPIHMLISAHRDGQLIARTVGHFGIQTVQGSTKRGGANAVRGMLRQLKAGESVGITPDGPRGPRMRVSGGMLDLARLSGMPILFCTFGVTRRRLLPSWDRFVLALPFSRGIFLWGEPLTVPRDADPSALEAARQAIETEMNRLTAEADTRCGQQPVTPATPVPSEAEMPPATASSGQG